MRDEYAVEGVRLHDPANGWYVMQGTSLPTLGGSQAKLTEIPGRDGALTAGVTSVGTSDLTISMMVCSPTEDRADLDSRFQALMALVRRRKTLTVQHYIEGAEPREARAYLASVSDVTYEPVDGGQYEFTLLFTIPEAWVEITPISVTDGTGAEFAGTARPVADFVISGVPSGNRVTVTDAVTGLSIVWEGAAVDGATLVIVPDDCTATWALADGTEYDASGGLLVPPHGWYATPDMLGDVSLTVDGFNAGYVVTGCRSF